MRIAIVKCLSDLPLFLLLSPSVSLFQAKSCVCHMCGAHLNRLHSCLYCVFFGCFSKKHIHEHAKNKRHNLGNTHTLTLTHPAVQSKNMPVHLAQSCGRVVLIKVTNMNFMNVIALQNIAFFSSKPA